MPVTFLAHQAPVLPLKRWKPSLDGVALVAGSAVPDLARMTEHSALPMIDGRPTWFDGHKPDQIVSWCLVVGLLLTWSARRWVLPRLAGHLPDLGRFHLRDIRLVGRDRHPWWMVVLCVLVGAITHVLLDLLTHTDRSVSLPGFDQHLFDTAGHSISVANLLQVVATIGLSIVTVWQMWEIGRDRSLCRWSGTDPTPAPDPPQHRAVCTAVVVAAVVTGLVGATQVSRGLNVAVMTWVGLGWLALCAIAAFVPRPADTLEPVAAVHST
ncbi:DUF4184 family protein [Dermatobacter hominis]|uniref:DUF4184 family protein n=1 Tax=Dermatobacter hominis TaxID=2884263 RepID=UPI001D11FA89|nr:DUF4184 family protein [Dermatobacter hominis]UDY35495.1 DUF4184 family protein [Dermatobacter hominis]